jgi:hypothetical protein
MSRRNLDIIIATGGALFAALVLVLGLVAWNEANFAKHNVEQQLSAQQIFFKDADKLTESERTVPGLVQYAGQQLTTGEQAQAYAGMIALHLEEQAKNAGYPGATYASIGTVQTELRTNVAAAQQANDPQLPELQKRLTAVNNLRDNQFRGETLRGMLLTSYGFSILGERAALAATVAFGIAAVAALLAAAGFIHAFTTPKEQTVLAGVFAPAHVSGE